MGNRLHRAECLDCKSAVEEVLTISLHDEFSELPLVTLKANCKAVTWQKRNYLFYVSPLRFFQNGLYLIKPGCSG